MKTPNPEIQKGIEIVLHNLGNLKAGEKVCIVTDPDTRDIGEEFHAAAQRARAQSSHVTVEALKVHGQEPAEEARQKMLASDLVLGLTTRSMAHTETRKELCAKKGRYLSLPEYSWGMLAHESLRADYKRSAARAKEITDLLTAAKRIEIKTPAGTDIVINAEGRIGNFCPGYVDSGHFLGSPPDIESNVSPVETDSHGVVVVDGSIPMPGLGRLDSPVKLTVKDGLIVNIDGKKEYVDFLKDLFDKYGEKSRVLAEFGIGFNEKAKLCGNMLIDEGCYGTFHFGFGSNSTVGGLNKINFHLDFIFYGSEVSLDGKMIKI